MVSTIVHQPQTDVKSGTRQRLIYRRPIVGGNVEATLLRDSGDWLRVQVDGEPYHKSIHVSDIVSWILDTDAKSENTVPCPKTAPSCDVVPDRSSRPFTIQPVDPARVLERYSHLCAERYARLESDRLYYGIPCTWTDNQAEIIKSQRAYDRVQHHVARLEALARGEQPSPFVHPGPMLYLAKFWRAAFAWLTLEDWRQRGRPQYEASPDELMNACKCGNDLEYCTCPKETEETEPARRDYNPWHMMIAGRV